MHIHIVQLGICCDTLHVSPVQHVGAVESDNIGLHAAK